MEGGQRAQRNKFNLCGLCGKKYYVFNLCVLCALCGEKYCEYVLCGEVCVYLRSSAVCVLCGEKCGKNDKIAKVLFLESSIKKVDRGTISLHTLDKMLNLGRKEEK